MRHPIEKSPRDGTAIILEDDASGTYDVAHWSTEAGEWVGENGEPTKITPTHWYPMPRDQYLLREDERSRNQSRGGRARRLAVSSIAVTLVAAVLIVTYFRAEVAAYVTRYAGHEDTTYHRAREPVGEPGFAEEQLGCPAAGRSRSGQRASGSAASCAGAADRGGVRTRSATILEGGSGRSFGARACGGPTRYRGARWAAAGERKQRRARDRTKRARKSGCSRAGGRRAKRAGREHGATSSSARRGTLARHRIGARS